MKQTFEAGDKVYCPEFGTHIAQLEETCLLGNIYLTLKSKSGVLWFFYHDGYQDIDDKTQSLFHATPENHALLEQLYGIDFEKPPHKLHVDGWVSVDEQLPTERMVLTYHQDGSIRVTDLMGDEYESQITHWQPLPEPPQSQTST